MQIQSRLSTTCSLALSLAMFSSFSIAAVAQQQATIEGLVIGRNGPSMSVKTADTPRLTVLLSDSTKATQKGGFLGMSRKDLGITALVPGLSVKVEGTYNADHQLVAKKIEFSRNSLNTARAIDAGLDPVNQQMADAQDQLKSHRRDIDQTQSDLAKQGQDLDQTKQGLATTTGIANQNTQGISKANQRFTTLDQYDTKDTITVNFANGSANVTKKDKQALIDFINAGANTPGYMIEVQGYASTVGSVALNQRLSAERADAVLSIIQQTGAVPLTRILAPAAMGTSQQIDSSDGPKHSKQAMNRRVVVTIVVNKGITGGEAAPAQSSTTTPPAPSNN